MREYIQSIRNRPEEHRRRFAYSVSLGATSFIALIWAVSLFSTGFLGGNGAHTVVTEKSPAESVRSQIGNSFSNFLGASGAASLDVPLAASSGGIEVVSSAPEILPQEEQVVIPF